MQPHKSSASSASVSKLAYGTSNKASSSHLLYPPDINTSQLESASPGQSASHMSRSIGPGPNGAGGSSGNAAGLAAAVTVASVNSVADKSNYTLNALEQIRNSLQPFANATDRPTSSASSTGSSSGSSPGHAMLGLTINQLQQPGLINNPLNHSSLAYLYSSNAALANASYMNNGAGSQPYSNNNPSSNGNSSKGFMPAAICDTNAGNSSGVAMGLSQDHALNIQRQFIKQLLENGCPEETLAILSEKGLDIIIENILKESQKLASGGSGAVVSHTGSMPCQPIIGADSNSVNSSQLLLNSQHKNSQSSHPIVIDRMQQQQYVPHKILRKLPTSVNSSHLDSSESTGLYSGTLSEKSALSSTSSVRSDSPVVNGIVNLQRDRLLPDQPRIISSSGVPIKEDHRYHQMSSPHQPQSSLLDSTGNASGYSSGSSSSLCQPQQPQSMHNSNLSPLYNFFSHSSSSVASSSSSSSSQYHRLPTQPQQSFPGASKSSSSTSHSYQNSSHSLYNESNKRSVGSKLTSANSGQALSNVPNSTVRGVYHRVISPTRSLSSSSSGPNVPSLAGSSLGQASSVSSFRPTDPLPPPPLPPHRSNMAPPPPPPPPHSLPIMSNEQGSRSSSASNTPGPQTDDLNPVQHYIKRQLSATNSNATGNSSSIASSISSASASYVSCRPNAFSYASSASSSSPQRGTSPISFASRYVAIAASSGHNNSTNNTQNTVAPSATANGLVSQVTQKLQNLNMNPPQPPQPLNMGSTNSLVSSPYSGQSSVGFVSIANSPPPSYAASSSSGRQSPTPTISSSSDYASIPVLPQRNYSHFSQSNQPTSQSSHSQQPFSSSLGNSLQNIHRKLSPISSASSLSIHSQSSNSSSNLAAKKCSGPLSSNASFANNSKHSLQAWSARQAISQSPIIMQSVKSQQVQKPVLQTAVAPTLPPISVKGTTGTASSCSVSSPVHLNAPTGIATQPTLSMHALTSASNVNGSNPSALYSSNASSASSTSSVKSSSTTTKNPPPYPSAFNKMGAGLGAASSSSSSSSAMNPENYHAAPPPPYSSAVQQSSSRLNLAPTQPPFSNYHKAMNPNNNIETSPSQGSLSNVSAKAPTPPPPPPPPPYSVSLSMNQQDSIAQIISGLTSPSSYGSSSTTASIQSNQQPAVQVPTTDPPSYASSMAALAAQRAVVVSSSGGYNNVAEGRLLNAHSSTSCSSTTTSTTYTQSSLLNMASLCSSNSSCSSIYSQPTMSTSSQISKPSLTSKTSLPAPQSNCDLVNTVESICTSQVSALQGGVTRRQPISDSTVPPLPPKPSSSGNNVAPPPLPHLPPHLQHHHQLISDVASITSSGGSINNDYDLESLSASSTTSARYQQPYVVQHSTCRKVSNNPTTSAPNSVSTTLSSSMTIAQPGVQSMAGINPYDDTATTSSLDLCDINKCNTCDDDVEVDGSQDLVEEDEDGTKKRTHHSPIPTRRNLSKAKEKERREFKVRNYSPAAFKFFMEQHVENLIKSQMQRERRRQQLESEMAKVGLSEEAQLEMRRMLCQKESNYIRLRRAKMDRSMFKKIKTIGVGAFGEVALVRKTDANLLYAMKTLRKADVLKRNQVAHVKAERDILAEADNEWVVKLYYSFQDEEHLYFVMDYIPGGDLMSLLIKFGIFKEPLAMFYIAELVLAVESVHKMGFIHRDIKPDNVLIDKDGHIKLTDFGLCTGFRWTHNSKYYHERCDSMDFDEAWSMNSCNCSCNQPSSKPLERRKRREHQRCLAHSLVGTPNYIAPEVLMRTGYTQLCDWWSVGVILYEMVVGQPPFFANTPEETQQKVINYEKTLRIPKEARLSFEVTDLILKLCCGAENRIGKNGTEELKKHAFFKSIDFNGGLRSQVAPYIPEIKYATDTSNFDPIDPDRLHSDGSDNEYDLDVYDEYGHANAAGVVMNRPAKNKEKSLEHNPKHPEHAFFEFTFRRFFDASGQAYPIKLNDPLSGGVVNANSIPSNVASSSVLAPDNSLYSCTTDSTMSETTSQVSCGDLYEEVSVPNVATPTTAASSLPMMAAIVSSCSPLTVNAVVAATAVSNSTSNGIITSISGNGSSTKSNSDPIENSTNSNDTIINNSSSNNNNNSTNNEDNQGNNAVFV